MQVAQRGDAQAHVLDGALGLAEVHPVADAVLVLEEHEQSGQEVADEGLGAEAEGDAHDPRGGDERRDVDAEYRQGLQDHPDQDDERHERLEHRADGRHPLGPPLRAALLGPHVLGVAAAVVLLQARGGEAPALVRADVAVVAVRVVRRSGLVVAPVGPLLAASPPPGDRPVSGGGGDPVDAAVQQPAHHQGQHDVDGDRDRFLDQPLLGHVAHREIGEGNGSLVHLRDVTDGPAGPSPRNGGPGAMHSGCSGRPGRAEAADQRQDGNQSW